MPISAHLRWFFLNENWRKVEEKSDCVRWETGRRIKIDGIFSFYVDFEIFFHQQYGTFILNYSFKDTLSPRDFTPENSLVSLGIYQRFSSTICSELIDVWRFFSTQPQKDWLKRYLVRKCITIFRRMVTPSPLKKGWQLMNMVKRTECKGKMEESVEYGWKSG